MAILLIGLSGVTAAAQETEDDPAPTVEDLERELKAAQNRLRTQGDSLAVQGAAIEELKDQIEFLQQADTRDPEMPTTGEESEDFPGSFRIPGIKARIKVGGFVKTALVRSFAPRGGVTCPRERDAAADWEPLPVDNHLQPTPPSLEGGQIVS